MRTRALAVALIAATGSVVVACGPPSAAPVGLAGVVDRVIDGDTVRMSDGQTVRIIGVDTPEVGQPCYAEATAALASMALNQPVALSSGARDDVDRYGRRLRYLDSAANVDLGLQMIKQGWAIARYDSRDGYGRHPREASYIAADAVSPARTCATPGSGGGVYYANCAAVRAAGKAPLYRGQPGYASHLDGDNDGVACE